MDDPIHPAEPAPDPAEGRVSVSLRVSGDALDPTEITRLLGVQPKFAARKGDPVNRGGRSMTQRSGIWTYQVMDRASPGWGLDDAIVALLDRLPADVALWEDLGRRFKIDLFCGLFMGSVNQGLVLRPSTLRLMADRGLTLGLDVYGHFPRSDER